MSSDSPGKRRSQSWRRAGLRKRGRQNQGAGSEVGRRGQSYGASPGRERGVSKTDIGPMGLGGRNLSVGSEGHVCSASAEPGAGLAFLLLPLFGAGTMCACLSILLELGSLGWGRVPLAQEGARAGLRWGDALSWLGRQQLAPHSASASLQAPLRLHLPRLGTGTRTRNPPC